MQAAQLIHAAGESSDGHVPKGTYAIALVARDENHLKEISRLLIRNSIKHTVIVECDEPYANQATAIGITPTERHKLKRMLSKLPLVKGFQRVSSSSREPGCSSLEVGGSNPSSRAKFGEVAQSSATSKDVDAGSYPALPSSYGKVE